MRLLAGLLVALLFSLAPGLAQDKPLRGVALVIGQSDYAGMPDLRNPENDGRDMTRLLLDLGFDVTQIEDGDGEMLAKTISLFVEDAATADVALIYYSGHGIEAGGQNYTPPRHQ